MPGLTVVLLTTALVVVVALLVAAAGKLARLDGDGYPASVIRVATSFAAVLTLAATVTAAFAALRR
ncbi:hypothetical protein ACH4U5_33920 [Streptomyces sp. NPDC020858]|uniref:hypothetical protein n=1 Tax=Streptomyces sp. NPDC020858 TaxID=3365097 RepID=UPI0037918237